MVQSIRKCGCSVMSKTNRIAYLDAVKLVTIYLVILGHVTQMMVQGWTVGARLWQPIYSFHMSLFMLVSGYFVSNKTLRLSFAEMVKTKSLQLLLPVVTCTVVCCIYLYFARDDVSFRDEIIGNSWFLKTLFVYYVLFWLVKRTGLNDWLLFVCSCTFLFIVPLGSTLQVNLLWPYFWGGYFLKKYNVLEKLTGSWRVALLFLLLFMGAYALQCHLGIPNYIAIDCASLSHAVHLVLFRYLVAFSGCLCVISLVAWAYKSFGQSGQLIRLASYGKYTLGVYVLQTILVINLFPDTLAWYVESEWLLDLVVAPLLSLIFLFICLYLVHLLSTSRILDLLFFGGQYFKQ